MKKYLILLFIGVLLVPQHVDAIPPPEFIIQLTSQIVPLFGWIFAMFLAGGGTMLAFARRITRHTYIIIGFGIVLAIVAALLIALVIDTYIQQQERKEIEELYTTQIAQYRKAQEEKVLGGVRKEVPLSEDDEIRKQYIEMYYQRLSDGDIKAAYEMTLQEVSYETYYAWYKDTTNIEIEKIELTGTGTFSIRVALHEGESVTHFGVLADVRLSDTKMPLYFDSEHVVILGNGTASQDKIELFSISNNAFSDRLKAEDVFVLDAREQIEYDYGRFPGSTHIKFADLEDQLGWKAVPTDRPVFVICWSGIRGSMVTSFLREHGIDAYYLVDGAKGWVDSGGDWEGEISMSAVYNEPQYERVFNKEEYNAQLLTGAVLIDSRDSVPAGRELQHSISVQLLYTPTRLIDEKMEELPPHSNVISVCDDYVDCFDARLIGIEAERRGHTFLGRYVYAD